MASRVTCSSAQKTEPKCLRGLCVVPIDLPHHHGHATLWHLVVLVAEGIPLAEAREARDWLAEALVAHGHHRLLHGGLLRLHGMRHGLGGIGCGHGGKLALRLRWRVPLIGCDTTAGPNLQDVAEEYHHDADAKTDGCADDAAILDLFVRSRVCVEAIVVGVARFSLISLVALGAALGISMLALLHQPRSEAGSSPEALDIRRAGAVAPHYRPAAWLYLVQPGSRRTARLMLQHAWSREHTSSAPFPPPPFQRQAARLQFALYKHAASRRWGTHVLDDPIRVCASLGQHGGGNNGEEERAAGHGCVCLRATTSTLPQCRVEYLQFT